jgi:AraC-like DNA-binding protein
VRDLENRREKIEKKVSDIAQNNNLGRHEIMANVVKRWIEASISESAAQRQFNYLRRG